MNYEHLKPGDRIRYWNTDLDAGHTTRMGTIVATYDKSVLVREDSKDRPDMILYTDIIPSTERGQ